MLFRSLVSRSQLFDDEREQTAPICPARSGGMAWHVGHWVRIALAVHPPARIDFARATVFVPAEPVFRKRLEGYGVSCAAVRDANKTGLFEAAAADARYREETVMASRVGSAGLFSISAPFGFLSLAFWANRIDRKSTRLNSSHIQKSRMPSSA